LVHLIGKEILKNPKNVPNSFRLQAEKLLRQLDVKFIKKRVVGNIEIEKEKEIKKEDVIKDQA